MKRLWLVGVRRGLSGVCQPCRDGKHEECAPVPVAVDEMGVGRSATAYTECRCLCTPEWMLNRYPATAGQE